ncbi:hypothetical protein [Enterobacter ludwigii]
MRKSFKILTLAVVIVAAALIWSWPYITMEFAGSAHYSEQDTRQYEFYTPDILKKMPRITPRYDFDFANITGPASHVYAVKFYGTMETKEIENYLKLSGYSQNKCDSGDICWRSSDPQESVYVETLKGENTVIIQVVYNFT